MVTYYMAMTELNKGIALFLDDERYPPNDGYEWVVVRSFEQAIDYVEKYGMLSYASFDHDLGIGKSGFDFVKWLVEYDMDMGGECIPSGFTFYVHSQNPVGATNIRGYLNSYLDMRSQNG